MLKRTNLAFKSTILVVKERVGKSKGGELKDNAVILLLSREAGNRNNHLREVKHSQSPKGDTKSSATGKTVIFRCHVQRTEKSARTIPQDTEKNTLRNRSAEGTKRTFGAYQKRAARRQKIGGKTCLPPIGAGQNGLKLAAKWCQKRAISVSERVQTGVCAKLTTDSSLRVLLDTQGHFRAM